MHTFVDDVQHSDAVLTGKLLVVEIAVAVVGVVGTHTRVLAVRLLHLLEVLLHPAVVRLRGIGTRELRCHAVAGEEVQEDHEQCEENEREDAVLRVVLAVHEVDGFLRRVLAAPADLHFA